MTNPRGYHLASMATRLARKLPLGAAVHTPVNAVLCGRRNNPPDAHSKPPQPALAVHNPVHYYELPELFMEFTSSMTGKSPSTTGAGACVLAACTCLTSRTDMRMRRCLQAQRARSQRGPSTLLTRSTTSTTRLCPTPSLATTPSSRRRESSAHTTL